MAKDKIKVEVKRRPDTPPSDILKYFVYKHLPSRQAAISKVFADIAWAMEDELEPSRQKDMALEHLLIAKDAAVRSCLSPEQLEAGRM